MGLAAALRLHPRSRLALARSLWLLACFGMLHALTEWGYVFIPVQATYMEGGVVTFLWFAHGLLGAVSFAFLLQFGVELVWPSLDWRWVRWLPLVVFALWALLFVVLSRLGGYFVNGLSFPADEALFATWSALARYLLALPGAALAGIGLFLQAKAVDDMELPAIARYLRLAAISFLIYAVFAGLLVSPAPFFPASFLNSDQTRQYLGLPTPVSVCRWSCHRLLRGPRTWRVRPGDGQADRGYGEEADDRPGTGAVRT